MAKWQKIGEDLIRITIPYKDIFTTVYLMKAPGGLLVFDAAASDADMQTYVLPVMAELGLDPRTVRFLFLSYNHRDHAGGIGWLKAVAPQAAVVSRCPKLCAEVGAAAPEDGTMLLEVFRVVTIPGHTADSAALLDTRTGTLVTGDCLQMFGIYGSGQWGANITLPEAHLQALKKVRRLPVQAICCAHDYHPCGFFAAGPDAVNGMLDACEAPLNRIRALLEEEPESSDEAICARYHAGVCLPTLGTKVVAAMRCALQKGAMDL